MFEEVKEILRLTGKSEQFTMLCVLAMILFVLGVMIALTMNNAMVGAGAGSGLCTFTVLLCKIYGIQA